MKKLMAMCGLGLALTLGAATSSGCTVRYDAVAPGWYVPGYYEANGYPVVVVSPGVRAYYINGGWYTYHAGIRTWRPYAGSVVYRGRVYPARVGVRVYTPRVGVRVRAPGVRVRVR